MSKLDLRPLEDAIAARSVEPAATASSHAAAPVSQRIAAPAARSDGEANDHVGADRVRRIVLSGVVGFVLAFALVSVGLFYATPYGIAAALGAGAFVGAFGGFGIGAMLGGSLSH